MKNQIKKLCFSAMLFSSLHAICQVPVLSSLPTAAPTIYLDFDGQTVNSIGWNNAEPFLCGAANISTTQITEIFNQVSEDFRPFAVNITTDSTKFLAAPVDKRIRIIVTDSSAWYPYAVAGIAYTGSFTWGNDIPGFVFSGKLSNSTKHIAECCSHESGHAVGLSHQSKYNACTLLERYSTGYGTGETSWAPIMGNSYNKNMTGWNNGLTESSCTVLQDNLNIIATQNGFTYRADDYTEILDNTTTVLDPNSFNISGIITTPTDKDAFKITLAQAGGLHIEATPFGILANGLGANLDIMVQLYNSANTLIRTYDPLSTMRLVIDTTLASGTYYLKVAGAGNGNTSNYGSLGSYTLSGSRGVLAIHSVTLKGSRSGNLHKLGWSIIADEAIATQVLESSTNAIDFSPILTDVTGIKSYNNQPSKKGNIYYRLKATSVISETMYSNIVVLNANGDDKMFNVSTLVQQSIYVTASENYNYKIYDANARLITSGKQKQGASTIDASNFSKGLYILQMISNDNIQTERIIKQ
jgi:Secretion system C-terminal sorting domain